MTPPLEQLSRHLALTELRVPRLALTRQYLAVHRVAEDESGGRVCFFYPLLSPCTAKKEWERESMVEIQKPIGELALQASFMALPTVDENDGATVLCYRSYFPAGGAAVY